MTSRITVAAVAWLLLGGLAVVACASVALAEPDSGHGGNSSGGNSGGGNSSGGASSGGASTGGGSDARPRPGFGFGFGQRPGNAPGGTPADGPRTVGGQSPADFGVHLPTRPGALIGDGRNGHTGILPRIGGPAQTGSAAPPAARPPSNADDQPTGASAAPPPAAVQPTPTATTGTTLAPTNVPSAVPTAPKGSDSSAPATRGWWPTAKPLQAGPISDDQGGATVPFAVPQLQLPTALPAEVFSAVGRVADQFADHVTGLATAAAALPFTVVSLPVVVPPAGAPGGSTDRGGRGAGGTDDAPRRIPPRASVGEAPPITGKVGTPQQAPPRAKDSEPFAAGSGLVSEVTYRAGYDDYLRAAGVGRVAAVAVPGVSGILLLTGAGGLIGYRQARAGSTVRASGSERFMN